MRRPPQLTHTAGPLHDSGTRRSNAQASHRTRRKPRAIRLRPTSVREIAERHAMVAASRRATPVVRGGPVALLRRRPAVLLRSAVVLRGHRLRSDRDVLLARQLYERRRLLLQLVHEWVVHLRRGRRRLLRRPGVLLDGIRLQQQRLWRVQAERHHM